MTTRRHKEAPVLAFVAFTAAKLSAFAEKGAGQKSTIIAILDPLNTTERKLRTIKAPGPGSVVGSPVGSDSRHPFWHGLPFARRSWDSRLAPPCA